MPYQLLIQTLDEGWQDRDFILLHTCFRCLTDCVEQENLLNGHRSWGHNDEIQEVHRELTELYHWWKSRIAALAEERGIIDDESEQYKLDNEMLIRLIKVRGYLWT